MEDELCQLMPGEAPSRSPDRADAAVYAIFELRHLSQGGSWLTAYGKTYCPQCKATLDVKRLKCLECGHEREPEPDPETKTEREPAGWAAAYAPRRPGSNIDQLVAQLRQWGEGNFGSTGAGHVPALNRILRKDGNYPQIWASRASTAAIILNADYGRVSRRHRAGRRRGRDLPAHPRRTARRPGPRPVAIRRGRHSHCHKRRCGPPQVRLRSMRCSTRPPRMHRGRSRR
jgi:hypothetical protein